jgi:DNA-binding NtrC family response regulator
MFPLWKAIRAIFDDLSGNGVAVADPSPGIPVVALVTGDRDRDLLKNIGMRDHLDFHFANTCGDAWNAANRLKSPVVLCERDLPGMEWQDTVRILASAIPHPCVILTSPVVDDYLWHETVARGGYDVLARPLREEEAARSIQLALAYWKSTSHGYARLPAFRR